MINLQTLDSLDAEQLRNAVRTLAKEVHFKQAPAATQTAPLVATQTAPPGRGELKH